MIAGSSYAAPPPCQSYTNVMCGPNCLWLAAKSYNITVSLKKLRYFADTDPDHGTSLTGMLKGLRHIGLEPLLIKTDWTGMTPIKRPAILLLSQPLGGHYVFLEHIDSKTIRVIDAPERVTWTRRQFSSRFTGYAIVVCADPPDAHKLEHELASAPPRITQAEYLFAAGAFSAVLVLCMLRYSMGRRKKA